MPELGRLRLGVSREARLGVGPNWAWGGKGGGKRMRDKGIEINCSQNNNHNYIRISGPLTLMLLEKLIRGKAPCRQSCGRVVKAEFSQGGKVDERILIVENEDVTQGTEAAHRERRQIRDDRSPGRDGRTADVAHHPMENLALEGRGGRENTDDCP